MKNLYFSICLLFFSPAIFSQHTLTTKYASWSFSRQCVERTIPNFIKILEMSPDQFKSEMKMVGVDVVLGRDYCYEAAEQKGSEATPSSPAFIFVKCDDFLSVDWYGKGTFSSVFEDLMNDLKDNYIYTKDGMKYYGIKYKESEYTIRFKRVVQNNTTFEFMTIYKVKE